jgi:formamidopyrimidine-DNA glycosylase
VPELPEVETIVRALEGPLEDRRLVRALLRRADLYRKGSLPVRRLADRAVTGVRRVGKNAVFCFEPFGVMVVNLGMTGRLVHTKLTGFAPGGRPARSGLRVARTRPTRSAEEKHLHGRFFLDDGSELRYYDARRFGFVYVSRSFDVAGDLGLGPDPFEADGRYLARLLSGRRAPVKALLLDQRILSGLGNIYADETLFAAGVTPRTPGECAVGRARTILSSARRVLERAIASGGSTIRDYRQPDGRRGDFQRFHAVYGRRGEPCIRCGTPIERIVLAGRGTHFCRCCQR